MPVEPRQVLAFGQQAVDYQERINIERLRRERLARARLKLKEHGIAAALVAGPNVRYTTGVRATVALAPTSHHAIVFADFDDPIVFQQHEHTVQNRVHCPWIKPENFRTAPWLFYAGHSVREYQANKLADLIIQALKEKGVDKERVGADAVVSQLHAALADKGIKVEPVGEVMLEARQIKTQDEINCLRMAGQVASRAWYKMFASIRPGISDRELSAIGMAAMMEYGAESPYFVSVRSGPLLAPNYHGILTDRVEEYGDLGFCDIHMVGYLGYNTCYYRTWKVGGKPTEKEKDWYKRTYDMLQKGVDAIKPGVTTADVAKQFPPCSYWGLKTEDEASSNAMAHGIGLSLYEPPSIHRAFSLECPTVIEENMVIAVETWYGENFVSGCRIENVGVVTATGWENIYRVPDEEIIVPRSCMLFE